VYMRVSKMPAIKAGFSRSLYANEDDSFHLGRP